MMKEYFEADIKKDAITHAMEKYPEECCGLIVDDKYIALENIATDKINSFKIDSSVLIHYEDDIKAVVHSHCDDDNLPEAGHASKKDMIQQVALGIPFGIIHLNKYGNYMKDFWWGDQLPVQDLVGRPFVHGVYDCYSLLRDYLRNKGVVIPIYPRDNYFWEVYKHQDDATHNPENIVLGNVNDINVNHPELGTFIEIDAKDLQEGDFIAAQMKAKVVNHCAVYIGNGLVLHHLYNKLSRREPKNSWNKYWTNYFRYMEVV